MSIFDAFGPLGGLGAGSLGALHPQARQMAHEQYSLQLLLQQRAAAWQQYQKSPTIMVGWNDKLVEVPRREGWCSLCREHHLTHCEWDVIEKLAVEREKQDAEDKVREKIDEWKQTPEGKQWLRQQSKS